MLGGLKTHDATMGPPAAQEQAVEAAGAGQARYGVFGSHSPILARLEVATVLSAKGR